MKTQTENLQLINLNFVSIRKSISKFLLNDKKDGVKKAWYYHHIQENIPMVFDTRKQFIEGVDIMKSQNITFYKTIKPSKEAISRVGAKDVVLHIYRKEDDTLQRASNLNGDFVVDQVAIAFDYFPAECETCIAEVIFVKNS